MADRVLPLFPLGTVLLPGAPLPLRVFEARYRQLMVDLLEQPAGDRRFGVVAIREGREVGDDGVQALYDIGCVALCTDVTPHPDGTYDVQTVGTSRFRLQSLEHDRPYLRGVVTELGEPTGEVGQLTAIVVERYADYRTTLAGLTGTDPTVPELPTDPRLLSYLVGATVVADLTDRQVFLGQPDAASRLAVEARWLARESALLRELSCVPGAAMVRVPSSLN